MSNLPARMPFFYLEKEPTVEDTTPIECCDKVMEVTRTATRRTHSCSICKSSWFVDVASRVMFGVSYHVSQQVPYPKVIDI